MASKLVRPVNQFIQKTVWKFPPENLLALYNKYMLRSKYHLEVGTAAVYYLANAKIEDRFNMNVTLVDTDEAPLLRAKNELIANGFHQSLIRTVQCEPAKMDERTLPYMHDCRFDTIAMSSVLHCIPGAMSQKLPSILDGLSSYMDENTKLFGSAQPNIPDDGFNTLQLHLMRVLQQHGGLQNENDCVKDIEQVLSEYFGDSNVKEIGYLATFEATSRKMPNLHEQC